MTALVALTAIPSARRGLRALGEKRLSVALLDVAGYFTRILEMVRHAETEGFLDRAPITVVDASIDRVLRALADSRPSTRAWFETARNHAIYSNEGGAYDDLLAHLKEIGLA